MKKSVERPNPLRSFRTAQGLGLRELARRIQMDPQQLSLIERGKAGVTVDRLHSLAAALGLKQLAKHLSPFVGINTESKRARRDEAA